VKRIAVLGGGISGLAAAYELEKRRRAGEPLDWHLYEASDRLGGVLQTTRIAAPEGEYILEGGPDGWVTEKPWLRELAVELGLESEIISCNEDARRTLILKDGALLPVPRRMRMMVPEDLDALKDSPLFSERAREAYAREVILAEELKRNAPEKDESVASFVRRHFGEEVLETLAAPLLSGVFGGDVAKLSVRTVMAQFVAMEREHGSLILGLQAKAAERSGKPTQPAFTSLKRGMQTIVEALAAALPTDRVHVGRRATSITNPDDEWIIDFEQEAANSLVKRLTSVKEVFGAVVVATSLDASRNLLLLLDAVERTLLLSSSSFASLAPVNASSAILVAMAWPDEKARKFVVPDGFGFLGPPAEGPAGTQLLDEKSSLLACTFVDQKFPYRAPAGARVMRAFFGGTSADALAGVSDEKVAGAALEQLRGILGPMPDPAHTVVRRWPRSLPQYEVGHLERMAQLDELVARVPGLHLLGNSYRGVGMPDLVRDARKVAAAITG
jgi:oxygen-dependent protoporphyrinogen oxidase